MSRSTRGVLFSAGLAVLLGACVADQSGPDSRALTVPLNADVVMAVADGVGEDVQTMRELGPRLGLGFLFLPLGHTAPPRDCPYDGASGRHLCPDVTLPSGIVISRSYAFFDGAGQAMETFHHELTASINLMRSVEGSVSRETDGGSFTGSVSHARNLTVSGLLGAETERTWNGNGSTSHRRTRMVDGLGSRSYELDATVAIANVVVPTRAGDRDPWPLSGTITFTVSGKVTRNDESRTFERTVVVTFNGTQFADATVNGESFTIDLAERRAKHKLPRPGPGR